MLGKLEMSVARKFKGRISLLRATIKIQAEQLKDLKLKVKNYEFELKNLRPMPDNYYNEVELNRALHMRINYAVEHCATCNKTPSTLTFCDACYMLRNGIAREGDYDVR